MGHFTRGGGGIDAVKPIYMKLTENGLDVSDRYDGPHIGGHGGGEGTVGGGGNLIVGLHGKITGKDRKIEALSVVALTVRLKAPRLRNRDLYLDSAGFSPTT